MAYISKTGINNTSTIDAEHITRIIDALDGTAGTEVSASGQFDGSHSGSFSGSFVGDGTNITGVTGEWDGSHNGNASITGSLAVTSTISGSNFTGTTSGTNTGDQDLSPYVLSANTASLAQAANVVANSATASLAQTANVVANSSTASFAITGSGVLFANVTASGGVSASGFVQLSSSLYIDGDRALFHKDDRNLLIINDTADFDGTQIGRTSVPTQIILTGPVTASTDISCSAVGGIITAETGAFNHIITDGETLEFRNAASRAVIGSLKFDATRGLDVKDSAGNEGKLRAKEINVPSGGALIVSSSQIDFTGLPTSDPRIAGRLWNNRGAMNISTGD